MSNLTTTIIKDFKEWVAMAKAGHPGYKPFNEKNTESFLTDALEKQRKDGYLKGWEDGVRHGKGIKEM